MTYEMLSYDCCACKQFQTLKMVRKTFLYISESPYILLTLAVLFWSGNFILGRGVRADIPPVALAFWRWFIATLIVLFLARRNVVRDLDIIKKNILVILLLAFLGVTVFNTLVYIGLNWTVAVNALLMQSVMPIMIFVISFIFFKENVTLRQIFGICVSLIGVLAIISKGNLFQ
ncbi:MAG: DMT family transporter, partial [Desulfobacteraceae bacterium]|nr:DMT family transporter [Desulfobacteraceae bacterium]